MTELLQQVADYYDGKIRDHGQTPRGVDWNGAEGQIQRFVQLARVLPDAGRFSVNDLGCGYGAFYEHLRDGGHDVTYHGIDIAPEMIKAASERFRDNRAVRFLCANTPDQPADFTVASGIFNVRMNRSPDEWSRYVEDTLALMDRFSRTGFAFNCLTSYSDEDKKREDLHYASPTELFDLCKRKYSRHVALLHDYGLYEFTIIVRKSL